MCNGKSKCGSNWKKIKLKKLSIFDLFDTTRGQKGWDPSSINSEYILECYKHAKHADTPPTLKSFLSNQNGGRATNHDNTKAIGGFKRAAS